MGSHPACSSISPFFAPRRSNPVDPASRSSSCACGAPGATSSESAPTAASASRFREAGLDAEAARFLNLQHAHGLRQERRACAAAMSRRLGRRRDDDAAGRAGHRFGSGRGPDGRRDGSIRRPIGAAPSTADDLRVCIEADLRALAREELGPRLHALAAEHGLTVSRFTIRNQRSRWGSCSRAGRDRAELSAGPDAASGQRLRHPSRADAPERAESFAPLLASGRKRVSRISRGGALAAAAWAWSVVGTE